MTPRERVAAVVDFGFTERQARFLVLVMQHTGVCVPRQYAAFAGIANGGKICNAFFDRLVRRGVAVTNYCLHNRARVYHLRHKALYYAIGERSSRHRRPVSARRAVERVMRLDAVLVTPDVEWFTTAAEQRACLGHLQTTTHEWAPDASADPVAETDAALPRTVPFGIDGTGRLVLLYLATEPSTEPFRSFLQEHGAVLRAAPKWTLRVVFPRPLHLLYEDHQQVMREELESPVHPVNVRELKWYFEHRRQAVHEPVHPQTQGFLDVGAKVFGSSRFGLLYRRWLQHGDRVFDGLSSTAIADALNTGNGCVECVVLSHAYRHLSPLVTSDRETPSRVEKGAARGDARNAHPQPRVSTPCTISSTSPLL